ncbi:hypothetical protein Lalb_Chr02g0153101 [Lupinus albus]|uniref:Uncharacterized protein n=1 Tax=Lupinus albus TaxID=3870 RepID=A0A6A4R203_LUPAL|nr:hypothetical protein Lalb_Chr02g0153101 [Lupinus albus]
MLIIDVQKVQSKIFATQIKYFFVFFYRPDKIECSQSECTNSSNSDFLEGGYYSLLTSHAMRTFL